MEWTRCGYARDVVETGIERPRRTASAARWALLAVVLVLAPALGMFAALGVPSGVPEARAAVQRSLGPVGAAARASFDLAMSREAAPLDGVETFAVDPAPAADAGRSDEAAGVPTSLLAARAATASGARGAALEAYLRHLAQDPGEPRAALELARLGPDPAILAGVLAGVRWTSTLEGVPARALALLAAPAGSRTDDLLRAEARALAEAVRSGALAADDRAALGPDGAAVTLDPTLEALRVLLVERCATDADLADTWNAAFHPELREARALAGVLAPRSDRWTVRPLGEERVVILRARPDGSALVQLAPAAALQQLWSGSASREIEVSVTRAGAPEGPDPDWARARFPLADAGLALDVTHRSPDEPVSAARWRRAQVAGSLGAAALAIAVAALLALRALGRAERLAALRSTFVASASHDLRTPVAAIGLLADNLVQGHARGREQEYATQISLEASRVARLVDDLLDFGRLERGLTPELERERVELQPWLEAFFSMQRAHCRRHGQALSLELGGLPADAHVDRLAVERALANLIDNAVRHGGGGGDGLRVRVSAEPEGLLRFEVIDSGPGAGRGVHLEDLFEAYARGGSASSGTGLGLAIVRALARAHGGDAELRANERGRGLTAVLRVDGRSGRAA